MEVSENLQLVSLPTHPSRAVPSIALYSDLQDYICLCSMGQAHLLSLASSVKTRLLFPWDHWEPKAPHPSPTQWPSFCRNLGSGDVWDAGEHVDESRGRGTLHPTPRPAPVTNLSMENFKVATPSCQLTNSLPVIVLQSERPGFESRLYYYLAL